MIRVVVIDREGFYIDAIMTVLENQPDVEAIAGVTIYEDFIEPATEAEIVILQYESDPSLTRQLVRAVRDDAPNTPVIVIGVPDDAKLIVSLWEAGVLGFVRDTETIEDVLGTLRVIANGEALIDPDLSRALLERFAQLSEIVQELAPSEPSDIQLTPRQEEVIELVARDYSNEQIAAELGVAIGTVKNHMNKILRMFGVRSRQQAAAIYLQMREKSPSGG